MAAQTKMKSSGMDETSMQDISSLTSNIQQLEWWYDTWSKIGLGLGVLTAVFGVLAAAAGAMSYWYNVRLKPMQDELTRLKEERLVREQQKTAEAQIKATDSLLRALWQISKLRSSQSPRRLVKGYNREKFIAGLKVQGDPKGTVEIIWAGDMHILEPQTFAQDIAGALKEDGWTVSKMQGTLLATPDPEEMRNEPNIDKATGIKIVVRDPENPSLSARALNWAFLSSGFAPDFIPGPNLKDEEIRLLIWPMPPEGGFVLHFAGQ